MKSTPTQNASRSINAWPWLVLIIAIFANIFLAYRGGLSVIGGDSYYLLNDDYAIIQRYAYNAANTGELVYNHGERVEGFSEPFSLFAIAIPLELLGIESSQIGLYIWIIHAIVSGILAMLLYQYVRKKSGDPFLALMASAIYISLPHHAFYAYAGLSVYLEALGILLGFMLLKQDGKAFWVVMAVLPLLHATMLPIWGMLLVLRWYYAGLRSMPGALVALLPSAGYFIFRMLYYGYPFPNTYYMKSTGVWNITEGLDYFSGFVGWVSPLIALTFVLTFSSHKRRLTHEAKRNARDLAIVLVPYLLFTLKVGGDLFPWHRFYFILLPACLILMAHIRFQGWIKVAGITIILLQLAVNIYGHISYWDFGQRFRRMETGRAALGLAIEKNTKPDALIAAFGIGQIGYFSHRPILDMLGKVDAHIAHLEPKPYRKVSHQKDSPDYSMSRKPDYVVLSFTAAHLADIYGLNKKKMEPWGYAAELALHPEFRNNYKQLMGPSGPIGIYCRNDLPCQDWVLTKEVYLK